MDPQIAILAAKAAEVLVQAMVSDGWAQARDRIARLFRHKGDTPAEESLALEQTHASLTSGSLDPDAAAGRWRTRLEDMLQAHPEAGAELDAWVRSMKQERIATPPVVQTATGNTGSTVVQVGRDFIGDLGNR